MALFSRRIWMKVKILNQSATVTLTVFEIIQFKVKTKMYKKLSFIGTIRIS
jgi:hypothetical protein